LIGPIDGARIDGKKPADHCTTLRIKWAWRVEVEFGGHVTPPQNQIVDPRGGKPRITDSLRVPQQAMVLL